MFCTSCGASVSDDHAFCSACGRPITKPLAPAEQDGIFIEAHRVLPVSKYNESPEARHEQVSPPKATSTPVQQLVAAPIYVTQQVQVASPVATRPLKSVGVAVLLALLFGPFGLFYASALGGILMLIGGIVATVATSGIAAPLVWIVCPIWAGIAASNYNAAIMSGQASLTQINRH